MFRTRRLSPKAGTPSPAGTSAESERNRPANRRVVDGLVAGVAAAVFSGAPSTTLTITSGGDLLESTRAVGGGSVVAGGAAHVAISLGWGVVLSAILPKRHTVAAGAAVGVAIAALDLGIIGRRLPAIRALDWRPQLLDHVAYGAIVGAVLSRRRSAWPVRASGGAGSTP